MLEKKLVPVVQANPQGQVQVYHCAWCLSAWLLYRFYPDLKGMKLTSGCCPYHTSEILAEIGRING